MPQLGPAFLHQPMSGIDFSQVTHAAAWLSGGARAAVPRSIRNIGAKPSARLYMFDEERIMTPLGVINKSWLGEQSLIDFKSHGLPLVIALAPSYIFETSVNLPESARNNLEKTIALRLEEISPIPPETAAVAIGDVKSRGSNRIDVPVAITRKETLQAVMSKAGDKPVIAIGASPDMNGKLTFVFHRSLTNRHLSRDLLIACIAVWAALLVCFGALEARQDQLRAVLEAHQSELRETLRSTRDRLELAAQLQERAPDFFTLAEMRNALDAATKALPEGSMVTEASAKDPSLVVAGYLAKADPSPPDLRLSPSPYAGFDRFDTVIPLDSSKTETGAP